METVLGLLTPFGIGGVLVWYLWFNETVVRPKHNEQVLARVDAVVDRHNIQVERITGQHNEVIARICTEFTQSLHEERELRKQERAELMALRADRRLDSRKDTA